MNDIQCFDVPHLGDLIPVVIYGRKSKDERARKKKRRGGLIVSQSIALQESQSREWCSQNGRQPMAFLYDDLTSGAQASRAGMNAVFDWARTGGIKEVVVLYFERFSRDDELEIIALGTELLRLGVVLRVITEPSLDPRDEYYAVRLAMSAKIARDGYERTSRKVREGLARVRQHGTWAGVVPYGWRPIPDPTGVYGNLGLEPDPEGAQQLAAMARDRARGDGWRVISRRYDKDPSNIRRMLLRSETAELIGPDAWEAATAVSRGSTRPQRFAYPFAGLARCGVCRKTLVGNNRKNKSGTLGRYYVCNGRVDHGASGTNVRHVVIAEAMRGCLEGVQLRARDVEAVRELLARDAKGPSLAEAWLQRQSELDTRRESLIRTLTRGRITEDEFDRHTAEIDSERRQLGPRPLSVVQADAAIEVVAALDEVLDALDSPSRELVVAANTVLRKIVEVIDFPEPKRPRVVLREPFATIFEALRSREPSAAI